MPQMVENPAADSRTESERFDIAADQAITLAGGDMRSAIRYLILANEFSKRSLPFLVRAVKLGRGEYGRIGPATPNCRLGWAPTE